MGFVLGAGTGSLRGGLLPPICGDADFFIPQPFPQTAHILQEFLAQDIARERGGEEAKCE